MTASAKPYYEVELVAELDTMALIHKSDVNPGGLLDALDGHAYAEVNIPYHTDEAIYCYTIHILNVPHHRPAMVEILMLTGMIEQIHAQFGHLAHKPTWGQEQE